MPLWFIEGMAEYLSVGPVDPHTAMWMRDAAREEKLPTIRDLGSARYFPYRYGQALWAYLAGRFGDEVVGEALRKVGPRSNDAETILKARHSASTRRRCPRTGTPPSASRRRRSSRRARRPRSYGARRWSPRRARAAASTSGPR